VEDWERDDWKVAAAREAKEEMEPLVTDRDFIVEPIHDEPITWGPEISRSAPDERTTYHIRYYSLIFLRDPARLLAKLSPSEFLLLDEHELGTTRHALGNPVRRARRFLEGGFDSVRLAWNEQLEPETLPAEMRHIKPGEEGPGWPQAHIG